MPPHRSESRELEEVETKEEVVEEKEKENGVEIAPRVSLIVAFYIEHLINRNKACSNAHWKQVSAITSGIFWQIKVLPRSR